MLWSLVSWHSVITSRVKGNWSWDNRIILFLLRNAVGVTQRAERVILEPYPVLIQQPVLNMPTNRKQQKKMFLPYLKTIILISYVQIPHGKERKSLLTPRNTSGKKLCRAHVADGKMWAKWNFVKLKLLLLLHSLFPSMKFLLLQRSPGLCTIW